MDGRRAHVWPGRGSQSREPAALWDITEERDRVIHVTVPTNRDIGQPFLTAHRRSTLDPVEVTTKDGIPVTTPAPPRPRSDDLSPH
jgi:hypothetical protein